MSVLTVEAAGLGVGEEALDAPSLAIEIERPSGGVDVRGDDERFAPLDTLCREPQPVVRFPRHGAEPACPGTLTRLPQERAELMQASIFGAQMHVLTQPNNERDVVFI